MYRRFIKRLLDIMLSLVGVIVLLPVLLVIAVLIKIDDPGPVLFRQKRVGIGKSEFHMMKLRTMKVDTPKDTPTHLLENPERYLTRYGKFLRKSSLDEAVQVFHTLSGKMSIVGPRPALWNQYDLIAERDKYGANGVRPGLTGWAQVNGRDELPIAVKAKFDGDYVKNISFAMDCKCFFMTVFKVLKREGVVEGAAPTTAAAVPLPRKRRRQRGKGKRAKK